MPSTQNYITQDSADARYQALGSLGSSTPAAETAGAAGTAGASTSASRSDHVHPAATGTPVSVSLAGSNAAGSATTFAKSDHLHAHGPSSCGVFHNTTQSCADNAWTVLSFNSERWNTVGSSMHSTSVNTDQIVIPVAGLWLLEGAVTLVNGSDYVQTGVRIRLNGATNIRAAMTAGVALASYNPVMAVARVYKLAAGDIVRLETYQDNTANTARNAISDPNTGPEFTATWIGVG